MRAGAQTHGNLDFSFFLKSFRALNLQGAARSSEKRPRKVKSEDNVRFAVVLHEIVTRICWDQF